MRNMDRDVEIGTYLGWSMRVERIDGKFYTTKRASDGEPQVLTPKGGDLGTRALKRLIDDWCEDNRSEVANDREPIDLLTILDGEVIGIKLRGYNRASGKAMVTMPDGSKQTVGGSSKGSISSSAMTYPDTPDMLRRLEEAHKLLKQIGALQDRAGKLIGGLDTRVRLDQNFRMDTIAEEVRNFGYAESGVEKAVAKLTARMASESKA